MTCKSFSKRASKTPKRANQERKCKNKEKLTKYIGISYFLKKDTLLGAIVAPKNGLAWAMNMFKNLCSDRSL